MDFTIIRGSGRTRRTATVPAWQAKGHREERERAAEDFKALVTRPATFGNYSGQLADAPYSGELELLTNS